MTGFLTILCVQEKVGPNTPTKMVLCTNYVLSNKVLLFTYVYSGGGGGGVGHALATFEFSANFS